MVFKKGSGWKACYDSQTGLYYGEYGGIQEYHLYEITKAIFDQLDKKMRESEAGSIMQEGRHLYMSVNDRSGPPYTVVFDDDYETLCPWADVVKSGPVCPDALTDAAVKLFAFEQNNRDKRQEKREQKNKE